MNTKLNPKQLPTRTWLGALAIAAAGLLLIPVGARGDFGFEPGSIVLRPQNSDGTLATQAGSHPYSLGLQFAFKTDGPSTDGGALRDLIVDLPPGLVGNPLALPACGREAFEAETCKPSTQVGVLETILAGIGLANGPVYNLVPPPGVAAQIGFSSLGFTLLGSAGLRSEEGYGVRVSNPNLPLESISTSVTIWGAPADKRHDPERGSAEHGTLGSSSDAPLLPYLTLPTSCLSPPELTLHASSKLNPGVFVEASAPLRDDGGNPIALSGCDAVPFGPSVLAAPSTGAAESGTGLDFQLSLPNKGLLNPKDGAVAETQPQKTVVTLPAGITANPAAVNGQGVCTLEQYKETSCPESSKLGTLAAHTPLLEEAIEGSVYLAAPHDNPFGSLLALYIVARVPERGVLVKQAGRIDADPRTGQLTTTIEGLPPVPYSNFEVRLREGPRAPLITPQACGTYTTRAELFPFSDPGTATVKTAPFTITSGANGGACAGSEAELPNAPALSAGSSVPIAGADSPFVLKVSRADGTQRFSSLVAEPPPGLVAKLAGVPYCPEAGIAQAAARTSEGDGAAELAAPSCPAASQVGTVLAGAGAGPSPYYVPGKAYLAGPYKGAPLSLEVITPAIAGPFDLGVVAVRAPLYVDEETAKITRRERPAADDPHGIPLDVRSARWRWTGPVHPQSDQLRTDGGQRGLDLADRLGRAALAALSGRRLHGARVQAEAEAPPQGSDQARRPSGAEGRRHLPQGRPGRQHRQHPGRPAALVSSSTRPTSARSAPSRSYVQTCPASSIYGRPGR